MAVFLDGTANNEKSQTNVFKLYNLATLQSRRDLSAVYVEGVGTEGKIFGAVMGWGIGNDVRLAYRYLAENYNYAVKDEIFVFGFSRGSYAARILAGLLEVGGLPDLKKIPEAQRARYVEKIYAAYKGKLTPGQRRDAIAKLIGRPTESVNISFMGLWDTVEALGFPDYKEHIELVNPRYYDQVNNIGKLAHAMSIDDDRARVFTPILATRPHIYRSAERGKDVDAIVNEVWFSGAHSDVGGGYANTDLDGVSLNWMIRQLKPYGLLPSGASVYENPYGESNDPESGFWGLIYRKRSRDLWNYSAGSSYNGGRLKIHRSVIKRLEMIPVDDHEFDWKKSNFCKSFQCVKRSGKTYLKLKPSQKLFEVVDE